MSHVGQTMSKRMLESISQQDMPGPTSESGLLTDRGSPLPLGATQVSDGINFSIFSRNATEVTLVIWTSARDERSFLVPLHPRLNRTGDIWHARVHGLGKGFHYCYRMDRGSHTEPQLHPFAPHTDVLDPYAKSVTAHLAENGSRLHGSVEAEAFDWGADQTLNLPLADSVIYELHIRGFTRDPSSGVAHPGTYLGLTEKIPYLKDLGITAVELLPVQEFENLGGRRTNPVTGELLTDYWGYNPAAFFAPKTSYSTDATAGAALHDFKEMVKRFHAAGIEVLLDVVFNHTGEGGDGGPTFSLRGIDNATYYMLDRQSGAYLNYSGCGNTVNCNHPVVRDLILDALRYWVTEMHVDGFRFDLASVLGRGQDGTVLVNPPLIERMSADPILANTKLIAEAWDASGLYQVGTFPAWGRWAEWNGRFRDDLRRFVKGDAGMVSRLATRLCGSPDLYQSSGRQPYHSINFITCHDGFTLHDLVSFNDKQNWMNGEDNRDGTDENLSWNCGVEGPAESPEVQSLRLRQIKNFAALLFTAHGVPMIMAGDEFGRTQQGNNNAYCQDNEVSWIDWENLERNAGLHRFFKLLVAFRQRHSSLRRVSFVAHPCCPRVEWHGVKLGQPDWSWDSRSLAMHLFSEDEAGAQEHIYLIANAHWEEHAFELPTVPGFAWHRFVDTTLPSPGDISANDGDDGQIQESSYLVKPRSVIILVGKTGRETWRAPSPGTPGSRE